MIAHSIGSYIALRLFQLDDINERIQQCCLLFPTFEYMAATPSGKTYKNIVHDYFKPLYYGAVFLDQLPRAIKSVFVHIAFLVWGLPTDHVKNAMTLTQPKILSKVVFLADCEMDEVLEPDYATIEKNKDRLRFIYSTDDGWTPTTYYDRLCAGVPGVKAHLTNRFFHTFTLEPNYSELAECLEPWLQSPNDFPVEKLAK